MLVLVTSGKSYNTLDISSEINNYLKNYKKPILDYQPTDSFTEPYIEFYDKILS